MRVFKFALICVIALVMVGCEVAEVMSPGDINPGEISPDPLPVKPTVPLKKRPIVPTTKLPRPRVVDIYFLAERTMVVEMAEEQCVAAVTITEHDTNSVVVYVVDDEVFELDDIPVGTFDIAVEVDGEVETYTVMN